MKTTGLLESYVVVRSPLSGVWGRILLEHDADSHTVLLGQARKAWQWSDAAATSGLAEVGPGGEGKICPPVGLAIVADVVEVLLCTREAQARWEEAPLWRV